MSLFLDYQNEYQSLLASAHTSIEELKNVTGILSLCNSSF